MATLKTLYTSWASPFEITAEKKNLIQLSATVVNLISNFGVKPSFRCSTVQMCVSASKDRMCCLANASRGKWKRNNKHFDKLQKYAQSTEKPIHNLTTFSNTR